MTKPLTVKLTAADVSQLDSIVREHEPYVRRHAVHLVAVRLGLAELRAHPEKLVALLRDVRLLSPA